MDRPLFPLLVLFFCSVFLSGCYTSEKLGREQPSLVKETLHSVVLITGEEIIFDRGGGKYRVLASIVGTTASGSPVTILADNVFEARTWRSAAVPFDSARNLAIAEVLLKDSTIISFEPPGLRYDASKSVFIGRNKWSSENESVRPSWVLEYRPAPGIAISMPGLAGDTSWRIVEVLLAQPRHRLLVFDRNGGRLGQTSEWIVGKSESKVAVRVPLESVLYTTVERLNPGKTIVGVIGGTVAVAAIVVGIALATKQSCPFLYSYDGAQYRFDAEPLGGATTEGLARTDYSQLEYLRPVQGTYRLLVRNEVDETQFVDAISLCVVDHDPTCSVVAEGENTFRLLPQPAPPVSATDDQGVDLMKFVSKMDGIAWQTHLDGLPEKIEGVRQTLTFKFVKPPAARRAQLVIHGGTTLWGSNVIRLMYNLLGTDVDRWYVEADRKGAELYRLLHYLDGEELYTLRVYVQKEGTWVQRGTIAGGGPFMHETQTVPLSVSGIVGDTLAIQIRPPLGFWTFDLMGVVFDDDVECTTTEIPLLTAVDQDGKDISIQLGTEDRRYFEMPTNEYQATLTFAAPPERPGLVRTVFAKTSGFYRLHLPKDHPPQTEVMARLDSTPGAIVHYAIEKYREWCGSLRAELKAEVRP